MLERAFLHFLAALTLDNNTTNLHSKADNIDNTDKARDTTHSNLLIRHISGRAIMAHLPFRSRRLSLGPIEKNLLTVESGGLLERLSKLDRENEELQVS